MMEQVIDYAPGERAHGKVVGRIVWALVLLFGYWLAWVLGPLSFILVPLAAVAGLWQLVRRRWRLAVAAGLGLLISPMAVASVGAVEGYFSGSARLHCVGLMHGASEVEPATRLQYVSSGCLVSGNEWMTQETNNLVLAGLVRKFGPMRGTYNGPYPDEWTALAAVAGAPAFDLKELLTDRLTVGGRTVTLRPGLGEQILTTFQQGPATDVHDAELLKTYGSAHAALVGGRCVVLEIPADIPGTVPEHRTLILIDAHTGIAFGQCGYYRGRRWECWR